MHKTSRSSAFDAWQHQRCACQRLVYFSFKSFHLFYKHSLNANISCLGKWANGRIRNNGSPRTSLMAARPCIWSGAVIFVTWGVALALGLVQMSRRLAILNRLQVPLARIALRSSGSCSSPQTIFCLANANQLLYAVLNAGSSLNQPGYVIENKSSRPVRQSGVLCRLQTLAWCLAVPPNITTVHDTSRQHPMFW